MSTNGLAFVKVPTAIQTYSSLTARDIAVYWALCSYADLNKGTCYPSYQTIAKRAGTSRSSAGRAIAKLKSLGLITAKNRTSGNRKQSNLYTVNDWVVNPVKQVATKLSRDEQIARVYEIVGEEENEYWVSRLLASKDFAHGHEALEEYYEWKTQHP